MYRVDEAICTGCGTCVEVCPVGAITLAAGRAHIDQTSCLECEACVDACPEGAIVAVASPAGSLSGPPDKWPVASARTSVEPAALVRGPVSEALQPAVHRNRLWPLVGGALVWAARELLPEILAAWRASRVAALQGASRQSALRDQVAPQRSQGARRHRWGRA
jgi:Fe-S-cluster-containing hydrogenase component 2